MLLLRSESAGMVRGIFLIPGRGAANPPRKVVLVALATWLRFIIDGDRPASCPPSRVIAPSFKNRSAPLLTVHQLCVAPIQYWFRIDPSSSRTLCWACNTEQVWSLLQRHWDLRCQRKPVAV